MKATSFHDPQECFEHAIFQGVFTEAEASKHMYMGTDETQRPGFDMFKHTDTRRYVKSPLIC